MGCGVAKAFVERLLDKNVAPVIRVGGRKGPLKFEEWLSDVNWENVACKRLEPPYIPPNEIDDAEIAAAIAENLPADAGIKLFS